MVPGKLPVPGRPTIWIIVGQGPTVLAVGAGGGCLDIFSLFYHFSFLTPSLWETARYRLKYCLKGPLSPNQPTNQPVKITGYGLAGGCQVFCRKIYGFFFTVCDFDFFRRSAMIAMCAVEASSSGMGGIKMQTNILYI